MALQEGERALIEATKPFTKESTARSIFAVVSTLLLLCLTVSVAIAGPTPLVQWTASVISGLLIVRGFVLYHDAMHGALVRHSPFWRGVLKAFGIFTLTPPRIWCESHNYHHAHTAKLVGSHVGSFPVVTVQMWRGMNARQRFLYSLVRSPLVIALGYGTLFFLGMCWGPFVRNPKKYWDSGVALAFNVALTATVTALFGFDVFLRGFGIPMAIAMAVGGYLFYAQHNYPDVYLQPRERWCYTRAALESSSYMQMGWLMRYFTANIGYHHIHHLNPNIPYYRLPEAMAAIPELQTPGVTSLSPRAIAACFSLKLWDPTLNRMVPYPGEETANEAEQNAPA